MFDRYNEQAQRSLFFARYEAGILGSLAIEPHHLLLGLLKDQNPLLAHLLATAHTTPDALRHLVYEATGVSTSPIEHSVEIPFSTDAKHVLQDAAEESNILLHDHIGPEHLLLGLLRVERGIAWDVMREQRLALAPVREALVMHVSATSPLPPAIARMVEAMHPDARVRPRRSGPVYMLTALDGPCPGRRAVVEDTVGGFASFGSVGFATRADRPPQGRVEKIGPISMSAATLARFVLVLEGFLGTPVIDDTGLGGLFEIELRGEYGDTDALTVALREQLGLQLTRSL
jgi:hypothetical protein